MQSIENAFKKEEHIDDEKGLLLKPTRAKKDQQRYHFGIRQRESTICNTNSIAVHADSRASPLMDRELSGKAP
jgi:hypothetical protein